MNIRPRRNRKLAAIRDMVQESHLATDHLIYPMFLVDGNQIKDEISSLPGNYRWSF
ncbi:MAG: porphobilinogen synthase, partial [Flavobacteriales bacterium]